MKEYLLIEIKTTGQLIDEATIVELKAKAGREVTIERAQYARAIGNRLEGAPVISQEVEDLQSINGDIWEMIDNIMAGDTSGAIAVQKLNAKRRELVRAIDRKVGERDIEGKVYKDAESSTLKVQNSKGEEQ